MLAIDFMAVQAKSFLDWCIWELNTEYINFIVVIFIRAGSEPGFV